MSATVLDITSLFNKGVGVEYKTVFKFNRILTSLGHNEISR